MEIYSVLSYAFFLSFSLSFLFPFLLSFSLSFLFPFLLSFSLSFLFPFLLSFSLSFLSWDRPGGGRGSRCEPLADCSRAQLTANGKGLYIISS